MDALVGVGAHLAGIAEAKGAPRLEPLVEQVTHDPFAAMNMLYEGLKKNATIVIVPSTAVESMQLGTWRRKFSVRSKSILRRSVVPTLLKTLVHGYHHADLPSIAIKFSIC